MSTYYPTLSYPAAIPDAPSKTVSCTGASAIPQPPYVPPTPLKSLARAGNPTDTSHVRATPYPVPVRLCQTEESPCRCGERPPEHLPDCWGCVAGDDGGGQGALGEDGRGGVGGPHETEPEVPV